ncbi:hypothetical protein EXU85_24120 [Spirosoma sp. KCTC 42546]|uniref:hypothetical protein n=1 Tax=Spirosoma sp. KCTC 42546 TaxID=2520506 RepID=UPI00115C162D|nr:hypothetical protein [Spirosoma sp. KCTC 42546]QDK81527.1 hypothetical protein EXU85_24120 [Spirosoma sp. KCTC 42546]
MNLFIRLLFSVSFVLSFCLLAKAQTYKNTIGLSLGTFRLRSLDQQASVLEYAGQALPLFGLTYRHQSENSRFNLRLSGGAGQMNPTRFGPRTYTTPIGDGKEFTYQISSTMYAFTLEADYLRRIGATEPGKFNTWVGGSIQESAWYADEVGNFPWLVNTATFSPVVQTDYAFQPNHSLSLRVDMAVVGLITRAIWSNFPKSTTDNNVEAYFKQGTRAATVSKLGNVNVQFGYSYRLSSRMSVGATYRARYLSYPDPRPIQAISSSISLDGEIHF